MKQHTGKIIAKKDEYSIIECEKCCFKHIIPLPNGKKLEKYYEKEFVNERPKMLSAIKKDNKWWELTNNEKFDYFEKFTKSNQRTVLDIGCGYGYFLIEGKKRGWQTTGIDLSEQSVNHCKKIGLNVFQDGISEKFFRGKTFDVIHMQDVLEHLSEPIKSINLIKKHLNPGGLLCIISPNDFNPLQETCVKLGYERWWVNPKIHLNYFNVKKLAEMLRKMEFKIKLETTTFPLELFLLMGENYIGNNKIGRKIHTKRKMMEFAFNDAKMNGLKQDLYRTFAKYEIGREIFIIGKKKNG